MAANQLGKEVQEPPADGVTALRFSARGLLLASSWDGVKIKQCLPLLLTAQRGSLRTTKIAFSPYGTVQTARLYDALVQRGAFSHRAPVLDCCFQDSSESVIFTAGLDSVVKRCVPLKRSARSHIVMRRHSNAYIMAIQQEGLLDLKCHWQLHLSS